mgnify:CR=1 FL=1
MSVIHEYTEQDFRTTRWSGGTTTELLLLPPGGDYGRRCFTARLSSAVVETEESLFTSLPGVRRWITPLEHPLVLRHEAGPEIRLNPYEIYAFDGGGETRSRGTGRDFNLMLQGTAQGSVAALHAGEEQRSTAEGPSLVWAFYAGSGGRLLVDRETHAVGYMRLIVAELAAGEGITLAALPSRDGTPFLCGMIARSGDHVVEERA